MNDEARSVGVEKPAHVRRDRTWLAIVSVLGLVIGAIQIYVAIKNKATTLAPVASVQIRPNPEPAREVVTTSRKAEKKSADPAVRVPESPQTEEPSQQHKAPEAAAQSLVAAPPAVEEPKEEDAGVGTYQGTVTVCKFGVAPNRRANYGGLGGGFSHDLSPLCIKSSGRILRLTLFQDRLDMPPVFYDGKEYNFNELHVGDLIEVRLVAGSGLGVVALQDVQLLKRAN